MAAKLMVAMVAMVAKTREDVRPVGGQRCRVVQQAPVKYFELFAILEHFQS